MHGDCVVVFSAIFLIYFFINYYWSLLYSAILKHLNAFRSYMDLRHTNTILTDWLIDWLRWTDRHNNANHDTTTAAADSAANQHHYYYYLIKTIEQYCINHQKGKTIVCLWQVTIKVNKYFHSFIFNLIKPNRNKKIKRKYQQTHFHSQWCLCHSHT